MIFELCGSRLMDESVVLWMSWDGGEPRVVKSMFGLIADLVRSWFRIVRHSLLVLTWYPSQLSSHDLCNCRAILSGFVRT